MPYDIWGQPLARGHCEVHPHVCEEYPCSACYSEERDYRQEQAAYEKSLQDHYEHAMEEEYQAYLASDAVRDWQI